MRGSEHIVRFGVFEANLATGELRRNGVRVKLQEQPFHVLAALMENLGELVTREELKECTWAEDTFVDFGSSGEFGVGGVRGQTPDRNETPDRNVDITALRARKLCHRRVRIGSESVLT